MTRPLAPAVTTNTGAAAVQLRLSGASFADIADILGLSNSRAALRAVERELAAQSSANEDEKARLRRETSMRLEALIYSVWDKATDPDCDEHLPAIRTAVTIIDRHAKLHGLDQPSEVIIHTPTQTELDQWVAAMVSHTMPDIIEGDVIDDDEPLELVAET